MRLHTCVLSEIGKLFFCGSKELKKYDAKGWVNEESVRESFLWFDLKLLDFYAEWKGRLVIRWPPPERSWWRLANRNVFPVMAILDESSFDAEMPSWKQLVLSWHELGVLPKRWKAKLAEWRGIYYISDLTDGKAYVGSAYGKENFLGRWENYAKSGHGGNRHLRKRDPVNFSFSILERVSPDMDPAEVIRLESWWKQRLHTQFPAGLNEN